MTVGSELRNWTTPGAQDAAQATYASVRAALSRWQPLAKYDVDVFLQGSYANSTNTRGDSDVDIVVMMRSAYEPNLSQLPAQDVLRHRLTAKPATTSLDGLRADLTAALKSYYGAQRVHPRNKCIRVDKRDGYVDADVVPSMEYRLYRSYPAHGAPVYIQGILIEPLAGPSIVNYPKEHIKNGIDKNKQCAEHYKPTVRQLKRLRRSAVSAGLINAKDAPGYLIECLTYNAPDSLFSGDNLTRPITVLSWLRQFSAAQLKAAMKSCDEVHYLFRDDPGRHDEYNARRVIAALWEHI